ncbi:MAG TPA: hypothetical protein VLI05_05510 [Candidatus Saccharimonadia bacterium]|nr:hypothetical protein [Candidatus Saccharimonadia bacterium]
MGFTRVKIVVTIPPENADAIRQALGKAGAGKLGNYSFCSFSVVGTGRFLPNEHARPHIGVPNQPETVTEERVEVLCDRAHAKEVVAALRAAHPYEEPAIDIYPLLDEQDV